MTEPLTEDDLARMEHRARRFQGAWTGTSGSLAAMLLHAIAEIRRLKVVAAIKENEPPISY
jgi:hypothetical protein